MMIILKKHKVIIGLLIPLVALTLNLYLGYRSSRNSEIARVEDRIRQTKLELARPIVKVDLINASDLLTAEMLANLKSIPIIIEITHIKGETAKKITIVFKSDVPIKGLKRFSSVEPYSIRIDSSGHKIDLNIPEIRQSAKLKFLLETEKTTQIKFDFFADQGKLLDADEMKKALEQADQVFREELGPQEWVPFEKWLVGERKSHVYSFMQYESPIDYELIKQTRTAKEIELLIYSEKLLRLRNDNFIKAAQRVLVPDFLHFIIVMLALSFLAVVSAFCTIRRRYESMSNFIEQHFIKKGVGIVDVLKKMGAPAYMATAKDSKAEGDLLFSYGRRSFFGFIFNSGGNPFDDYYFTFIFQGNALKVIKDNNKKTVMKVDSTID